jgi:hypothetical protein
MLQAVDLLLPDLLPYVVWLYGEHTRLWVKSATPLPLARSLKCANETPLGLPYLQ